MTIRKIIENNAEFIGPKEISKNANISEASAKNISRDKLLKKIVKKEVNGYFIPNYNLKKVKDILIKK